MGCFTLQWLMQVLIWCVVLGAIYAIIQLLIPFILGSLPPIIGQVVQIILWAVIAIIVIYICFALISCLLGMAGGFPGGLLQHR